MAFDHTTESATYLMKERFHSGEPALLLSMAAVQNADFALNGTHAPLTHEPFTSSSKSATHAEEERDPAVTTASEVGDAEHTRPRYFSYMRGPSSAARRF